LIGRASPTAAGKTTRGIERCFKCQSQSPAVRMPGARRSAAVVRARSRVVNSVAPGPVPQPTRGRLPRRAGHRAERSPFEESPRASPRSRPPRGSGTCVSGPTLATLGPDAWRRDLVPDTHPGGSCEAVMDHQSTWPRLLGLRAGFSPATRSRRAASQGRSSAKMADPATRTRARPARPHPRFPSIPVHLELGAEPSPVELAGCGRSWATPRHEPLTPEAGVDRHTQDQVASARNGSMASYGVSD